jgi:hypothetical protein
MEAHRDGVPACRKNHEANQIGEWKNPTQLLEKSVHENKNLRSKYQPH